MVNSIFVSIKGSTQGLISKGATNTESLGKSYVNNHDDEILVTGFKTGASNPANSANGRHSGKARSNPFVISKNMDKSTPLLYNALVNGETLSEVVLKTYRTSKIGFPEHHLTYTLKDAVITNISADTGKEKIFLTYREITFEHVPASTISKSEWKCSPIVCDKSLLQRIADRTLENIVITNKELTKLGGGVINVGTTGASALGVYFYNQSAAHIFFKEPQVSTVKVIFKTLFSRMGLTPTYNFGSMGFTEGLFVRAIIPALEYALLFELGVTIGSGLNATTEELYAVYLREYEGK